MTHFIDMIVSINEKCGKKPFWQCKLGKMLFLAINLNFLKAVIAIHMIILHTKITAMQNNVALMMLSFSARAIISGRYFCSDYSTLHYVT